MEPGDYQDWDKLIEQAQVLEGLDPEDRLVAAEGYAHLRSVLGRDFLRESFPLGHPIHWRIINQAPWTRQWLPRIGLGMKSMQGMAGVDTVVRRFKDQDRYREALSVLLVAQRMAQAGFAITFDPAAPVLGSKKVPDLRCEHPNAGIVTIEVTVVGESAEAMRADKSFREITNTVFSQGRGLTSCGKVLRTLSRPRLEETRTVVEAWVQRVNAHRGFEALVIPGVLQLGAAGELGIEALTSWAKSLGLSTEETEGPDTAVDEVLRIRSRLREKQNQLQGDCPGVLVIMVDTPLFPPSGFSQRLGEVEEEVSEYTNISCAVISWSVDHIKHVFPLPDADDHPQCELVMGKLAQQHLFIKGRYPSRVLSQGLYDMLKWAFLLGVR